MERTLRLFCKAICLAVVPVSVFATSYHCPTTPSFLDQQFKTNWYSTGTAYISTAYFTNHNLKFAGTVQNFSNKIPDDPIPHLQFFGAEATYIEERALYSLVCLYQYSNDQITTDDPSNRNLINFTASAIASKCKVENNNTVICE